MKKSKQVEIKKEKNKYDVLKNIKLFEENLAKNGYGV